MRRSAATAAVRRERLLAVLPVALAVIAGVAYAAISVYRHDHFASQAFDLGVQDQTVWGYSRLQMIPNTLVMIRNLLGDHFHPILMAIAPLYWIWDDVRVLFVVQAMLLAVPGLPIFWWARERLGLLPAFAFEAAYLVFWGILSGVVFDFHHIAFAVPAISFGLYAVLTNRNRLFWAMLALGLLTREDIALTFAALGVYIVLIQHRWRLGAAIIAICAAWFAALIEVVMPAIAGAPYNHWTYQALGIGPGSAFVYLVRHPIASLQLLVDNPTKVKLWGGLLGAFAFLPILSPILLVAAPTLLERLWSTNPALWSASFHYSMVTAPVLAFAGIDSVARLQRAFFTGHGTSPSPSGGAHGTSPSPSGGGQGGGVALGASLVVLVSGLIVSFGLVRPLDELGTYISASQATDIESCLAVIPADASVSASNVLVPHLSHRRQIYVVTARDDADYLALDVASDPGRALPGVEAQIRTTISGALSRGYGVACSRGTSAVLHRGASGSLSPELSAFLAQAG